MLLRRDASRSYRHAISPLMDCIAEPIKTRTPSQAAFRQFPGSFVKMTPVTSAMNVELNAKRPALPIAPVMYASTMSMGAAHHVPATPAARNAIKAVIALTTTRALESSLRGTAASTRPRLSAPIAIVAAVANSPTAAPTATMTATSRPRRSAEGQLEVDGCPDRTARASTAKRPTG